MKIAHVTDCYLPRTGGIELQVHDLSAQQRTASHDVSVLTSTPGPTLDGVLRLDRHKLATVLPAFDAIHVHTSLFSPFAWTGAAIGSELGRPTVVTMHSVPPPGWLLRGVGAVAGWRRLNIRWTAVSEVAAEPLRQMLAGQEVNILHNGIDPARWQPAAKLGTSSELVVVSVMRMSPRKRPLPLVRILERVRGQLPRDVRLRAVIVGEGPQRAAVRRALSRRGMLDWVDVPGRLSRDDIRSLYSRADLYLAPATMESFGIAALEARCAGMPVVAMACGGVGEFVRNGIEGHLVRTDREMAGVAARLLSDPDELGALRAHNSITEPDMTWGRILERSLHAYGNDDRKKVLTVAAVGERPSRGF